MKSGSGMQPQLKACFGDLEYTENLPKLTTGIPLETVSAMSMLTDPGPSRSPSRVAATVAY